MGIIKERVRTLRKNQTSAENFFWGKVRANQLGINFRRQYPIVFYSGNQRKIFIADFICKEKKIVIELDGGIHKQQKEYDKLRSHIINQLGFQVIRFTNKQVLNNFSEIKKILSPLAGKGVRQRRTDRGQIDQTLQILFASAPGQNVVILTVGNDLRGDDGVGPYLAKKLTNHPPTITVLDGSEHPEYFLDQIIAIKPVRVIIIDAADFGGAPGALKLIPAESIPETTLSTHLFPLGTLAKILESDCGTRVVLLGIQLKNSTLGSKMSASVKKAADKIIKTVNGSML